MLFTLLKFCILLIWILFAAQNVFGAEIFVFRLVSVVITVKKLLSLAAYHGLPILYKGYNHSILIKWPLHDVLHGNIWGESFVRFIRRCSCIREDFVEGGLAQLVSNLI